ncbi:MAG: hypothetical protein HQK49_09130 [Oligoflexia bacterium]|nr:hypothetical protein [Oligoflexia bacterium]
MKLKFLNKIKFKIVFFFFKIDGKKKTLKFSSLVNVSMGLLIIMIGSLLFSNEGDQSLLDRSFVSVVDNEKNENVKLPIAAITATSTDDVTNVKDSKRDNELTEQTKKRSTSSKRKRMSHVQDNPSATKQDKESDPLIYNAPQVIAREDGEDDGNKIPIGTSFIGKLLTPIDTRVTNSLVRIILPFGSRNNQGPTIPKNTILFAQMQYFDDGEKVHLNIVKGVTSEGIEFEIKAQVLDIEDFSPGLNGNYHSNADKRLSASLGWNLVGAAGEIMQDREVLGGGGSGGVGVNGNVNSAVVMPKSNLKNAILEGTKRSVDNESGKVFERLNSQKPYVTIESGREVLVTLIESFINPKLN